MVFSSLIFLFAFFTTNMIIYYFSPKKARNYVLLLFSLIFYAWGGPKYLVLLMGETWLSWKFALGIENAGGEKSKKVYLISYIAIMLGLIGFFKYTGFFLENLRSIVEVPQELPEIILPIGISFYTFQLMSYVVDVYRDEVQVQTTYHKLLLYSSLYYQCIAGPIVRYETVEREIDDRRATYNDVYAGLRRFAIGLAKKAVLANSCAAAAKTLLPETAGGIKAYSAVGLWAGMIFFTLQIYLDFSGYSDMAIGMGRMTGFHFKENFNYPYIASSVKDFWRRWHISLSTFFRDYVYIPLGGSRDSKLKYIRNLLVVWFLTGLWHGASWNYVIWGLYYLVFLLIERFLFRDKIPVVIGNVYTLFVIIIGWTIFKYEDAATMWGVLRGLFGIGVNSSLSMGAQNAILSNVFLLIASAVCCVPLGRLLRRKLYGLGKRSKIGLFAFNISEAITPATLVLLSVFALVGDSYNPFLYFRF